MEILVKLRCPRGIRASILSTPLFTRRCPCVASSRASLFMPTVHDAFSDTKIIALASEQQSPLDLADLVRYGHPPLSEPSLLASANFALSHLPIRLARRIRALRNLPYIVVSNQNISRIYNNYLHSLSILLPYWQAAAKGCPITSLDDETRFTDVLADLVATHIDTIPTLAKGFLQCRRYISPIEVTRFLDDHLRARIGTRLVAEQHIALHFSSQPPSAPEANLTLYPGDPACIGLVDTKLRPAHVVEACADFVADICELRYGFRPQFYLDGELGATFTFVPTRLEYIATELLKNAFRATIEAGSREPVVVTIAPEPPSLHEHNGKTQAQGLSWNRGSFHPTNARSIDGNAPGVTIRVRDRGGGISPEILSDIWSYSFTTFCDANIANRQNTGVDGLAAISFAGVGGSSIAGLGYGLPLSRAYAEHFSGGIAVQSLRGWGTDVYLRLKGVDTACDMIEA